DVPSGAQPAALCILTPLCMNRSGAAAPFTTAERTIPVGVMNLRSFLSLADAVHAGRMSHEDLVRLIQSNVSLDFMVDLLDRAGTGEEVPGPKSPGLHREGPGIHAPDMHETRADSDREPAYWLCSVASDHATQPEEFLEVVVAKRLVFGLGADVP